MVIFEMVKSDKAEKLHALYWRLLDNVERRMLLASALFLLSLFAAVFPLGEMSSLAQSTGSNESVESGNVIVENVQFRSSDVQIDAYLASPKIPGAHPAIIIIHDSRGLDDQIRGVARRFAEEGFVALAPDMLSSAGGMAKLKSAEEIAEAAAAVPTFVSIGDLKAAVDYLSKNSEVDPQKISSVGIGWGGYKCFFLAIAESRLYRAIIFYGTAPDVGLEMIKAPILAHYAKFDNRVSGNAPLIAEQMKRLGKRFEYFVYDNTDSGFFSEGGPRYNEQSAKLAWTRTIDFLRN